MTYAIPKTAQINAEKNKAKELIQNSVRDYLTAKITLPLGNPNLKKVHTNQFLWTELPDEFTLENWETIADAFQSKYTRYTGSEESGYTINRWYIEGSNISVDLENGKFEMDLSLNAFPSSTFEYLTGYNELSKAYTDATKNSTSTSVASTKTSSTKKTTNATTKKTVINESWVKKYNIPAQIVNIVKKVCKVNWNNYKNCYELYKWMDAHVQYDGYYEHRYSPVQVINRGKGNCVDNSRTYRLFVLSLGVKCNFVQNTCTPLNHQYNKIYPLGKGIIVDCGRGDASWGSNWGGHASCGKETSNSW